MAGYFDMSENGPVNIAIFVFIKMLLHFATCFDIRVQNQAKITQYMYIHYIWNSNRIGFVKSCLPVFNFHNMFLCTLIHILILRFLSTYSWTWRWISAINVSLKPYNNSDNIHSVMCFLNSSTVLVCYILTPPLHIYDVNSYCCIFLCWRPKRLKYKQGLPYVCIKLYPVVVRFFIYTSI